MVPVAVTVSCTVPLETVTVVVVPVGGLPDEPRFNARATPPPPARSATTNPGTSHFRLLTATKGAEAS
jgi:hypothetical protein